MQTLRHAKHITSIVLAWFVLSLGAAVATPLIQSQDFEMVCSSNGMYQRMLNSDEGSTLGSTSRSNPKLKCPLCMLLDAPPDLLSQPQRMGYVPTAFALGNALTNAPVASTCSTPLPARGPPANTIA
jgi:hypothetical protein